jgi:hypothetical protein
MAEALLVGGAALLVAAAVLWFITRPFLAPRPDAASTSEAAAVRLLAEREAALATLRDLDADRQAGRLSTPAWEALRAQAVARGVAALSALDELESDGSRDEAPWRAEIEAEVAEASRRLEAAAPATCGSCGSPVGPGDRFCARCGRSLGAAAAGTPG